MTDSNPNPNPNLNMPAEADDELQQNPNLFSRKTIRDAMLNAKPESRAIRIFGFDVTVRQPSLQEVMAYQNSDNQSRMAAEMIQRYVFMPDGKQRVFDEADIESIMNMPFGADMNTLQDALNDLMGVQKITEDEIKN